MNQNELLAQCTDVLPGHGPKLNLKATLASLADVADESVYPDYYGSGEYLESFEAEVAEMFGKPASVFMPSGTMAQQIALRIWCDRSAKPTVVMHPSSHLETAEHLGYQFLHGIHRIQFAAPESLAHRVMLTEDLEKLGARPGAVLLELPCRPLGGQLPEWDELVRISQWCREREIKIHLDGARVWQCQPFYQRSYAEIAALFDSLYVSFYKDIGGLCGCMLLGDADFVSESRIWQRRYGGNLFTQAPFTLSARTRMHEVLPLLSAWNERAREIAAEFSAFDKVIINPNPPQVNFFQLYIRGDSSALLERHNQLAAEQGVFLFNTLRPAAIPGFAFTEIHVWENAVAFDKNRIKLFVEELLA